MFVCVILWCAMTLIAGYRVDVHECLDMCVCICVCVGMCMSVWV